jgi:hypothetical protein
MNILNYRIHIFVIRWRVLPLTWDCVVLGLGALTDERNLVF